MEGNIVDSLRKYDMFFEPSGVGSADLGSDLDEVSAHYGGGSVGLILIVLLLFLLFR